MPRINNKKLFNVIKLVQRKSNYKKLLHNIQSNYGSTLQKQHIEPLHIKPNQRLSIRNIISTIRNQTNTKPPPPTLYKEPVKITQEPISMPPPTLYKRPVKITQEHSIIDSQKQHISTFYKIDDCNLGISLFNEFQNIKLLGDEKILKGLCIMIYDPFLTLNDSKKRIFMKNIKYKMSIDLDKKDLYKTFKYSTKRFKKSTLQADLIDNKCLETNAFHRYLGDYFGLNIIIKKEDGFEFINDYSIKRHSVFIIMIDDDYYIQYNINGHSFLKNDYTIEFNKIQDYNMYSKKTLKELQNIATNYNIITTKQGKSGLIKRTKKELIDKIINISE